jgi:hypothetical protein
MRVGPQDGGENKVHAESPVMPVRIKLSDYESNLGEHGLQASRLGRLNPVRLCSSITYALP